MREILWSVDSEAVEQLRALCDDARSLAILVLRFESSRGGAALAWREIEPWTRSRAVTVADVAEELRSPELDVALCCDLVYLREGTTLVLPDIGRPPSAGLLWALSRAGRQALAGGLLDGGRLDADDAVGMGLAQGVVPAEARLPLPEQLSESAVVAARDLMRSRAGGEAGRALELATFRLLFAAGDPIEGAMAFLERRAPRFSSPREKDRRATASRDPT